MIKRRLWWKEERIAEMERKPGFRDRFRWYSRTKAVPVGVGSETQIQDQETWYLNWEGAGFEYFTTETRLRLYLIRLAYSIKEEYLIPSVLLHDAGLWYTTGDWVDDFYCTDKNDQIASFSGYFPGVIPEKRVLYLSGLLGSPERPAKRTTRVKHETAGSLIRSVIIGFLAGGKKEAKTTFNWTEIFAPEIPDEECLFVLPLKEWSPKSKKLD